MASSVTHSRPLEQTGQRRDLCFRRHFRDQIPLPLETTEVTPRTWMRLLAHLCPCSLLLSSRENPLPCVIGWMQCPAAVRDAHSVSSRARLLTVCQRFLSHSGCWPQSHWSSDASLLAFVPHSCARKASWVPCVGLRSIHLPHAVIRYTCNDLIAHIVVSVGTVRQVYSHVAVEVAPWVQLQPLNQCISVAWILPECHMKKRC